MNDDSARVVIVSDAKPERNGVGSYYVDLAAHLRPYGIELCSIHPSGRVPEWINLPLVGDLTQRVALPSPSALASTLRRFRPTHVVVPTPGPYGMLGAYLGSRLGAEVIVPIHTDYPRMMDLYWNPFVAKLARAWFYIANRTLFRYATRVLASSPMVVDDETGVDPDTVGLMGTLLAEEFLVAEHVAPREEIRSVLFVGRLAAEKRIDAILRAADEVPDREFTIAGDGPLRTRVESAARRLPNLRYLGWVDRSGARAAMDAADLFVLPSKVESFGTVALEAMSRRCVVLVSRGCGISTWPDLKEGLFVMAPGEDLSSAIKRVASIPLDVRQGVAQKGFELAHRFNEFTLTQWRDALSSRTIDDGSRRDVVD